MPVLYIGRNMNHITGKHLHSRLALLLVPASACHTYKHLSASLGCTVDVPVVATSRLKSNITERDLLRRYRRQVTVAYEVLCICGIGLSYREYHLALESGLSTVCLCILGPHVLSKTESAPSIGPSGIECDVGKHLGYLGTGHAVLPCELQMMGQ